jgi:hypothetical protein
MRLVQARRLSRQAGLEGGSTTASLCTCCETSSFRVQTRPQRDSIAGKANDIPLYKPKAGASFLRSSLRSIGSRSDAFLQAARPRVGSDRLAIGLLDPGPGREQQLSQGLSVPSAGLALLFLGRLVSCIQ